MTNVVSFFKINCKNVKGYYCGMARIELYFSWRKSTRGLVYDVTEYRYKGRSINKVVHYALGLSYEAAYAAFATQVRYLSNIML